MSTPADQGISTLIQREYSKNNTSLRLVQKSDIESIRIWRNRQTRFLRQNGEISSANQIKYFDEVVFPEYQNPNPKLILFAISHKNILVGYGGLVHLDWNNLRGEISFLLNPEISEQAVSSEYKTILLNFLSILFSISFKELELHKITTETYDFREEHIAFLEEAGMKREGLLIEHVKIDGKFSASVLHRKLESEYLNEI